MAQPTPSPSPDPGAPTARAKTGIPRNPGRHDLGMKATLLFPDREIVQRFYVPLIYTACRTCYSELEPGEIFRRAESGEIDQAKMQKLIGGVIESGHGPAGPATASSSRARSSAAPRAARSTRRRCRS